MALGGKGRGEVGGGGSSERAAAAGGGSRAGGGGSGRFALTEPHSRLIPGGSSAPRRLSCLATVCADQSEIPPRQRLSQWERRKR